MSRSRVSLLAFAISVAALVPLLAQRGQPAPASARPQRPVENAADVIPGPNEQFTTLPGFKVERVVPEANRASNARNWRGVKQDSMPVAQ